MLGCQAHSATFACLTEPLTRLAAVAVKWSERAPFILATGDTVTAEAKLVTLEVAVIAVRSAGIIIPRGHASQAREATGFRIDQLSLGTVNCFHEQA